MTENERLINMLIELRQKHNLTQENIADRIGMARNNYSRLEKGVHELRIGTIAKILDVFGMELIPFPKK